MERRPEEHGAAGRRRRAWKTALGLLGLVGAVLGAWLIYQAVRPRPGGRRSGGLAVAPGAVTQPAWRSGGPAEMVASPLAAVGLVTLDADPGQVPPPAGARRVYGFQRRLTDQLEQLGRYELYGSQDDAAGHYLRVLKARGYRPLKDATDATGRRMLVFMKDRGYATIALRRSTRQGKMLTIVVTIVEPTGSERG